MFKKINRHIKLKDNKFHCKLKIIYTKDDFRFSLKLILSIIIFFILIFSFTKRKKKQEKIQFQYFACFGGIGRRENLYIRDLISYYLSIGFEKFILGDNNFPNIEKISHVTQDYINKGILDIIEVFGSSIGQDEFYEIIYEKYKNKCAWISFFDLDEYLRMHSEDNQIISIKQYLSNPVFEKCESISINWLMYSDNNLLNYDNRTVLERFTHPLYKNRENRVIKSIVRGNLNKIVFYPNSSSHVPNRRVHICNSLGKRLKHYSGMYVKPPLVKYTYLMHFTTKTIEEYLNKIIKRGVIQNQPFNITEAIKKFFQINDFSEEKLKIFEKAFNKTFDHFRNVKNFSNKVCINFLSIFICLFCLIF